MVDPETSIMTEAESTVVGEESITGVWKPRGFVVIGNLADDLEFMESLKYFQIPIEKADDAKEWIGAENDRDYAVVLNDFRGTDFKYCLGASLRLFGPTVLRECIHYKLPLPKKRRDRPLYSLIMKDVTVWVSGFKSRDQMAWMKTEVVDRIHWMGGSVRKDFSESCTHLISTTTQSDKYKLATSIGRPVMHSDWIDAAWAKKDQIGSTAVSKEMIDKYRLPPFFRLKIAFNGFPSDETEHMIEQVVKYGGEHVLHSVAAGVYEPGSITHMVVDADVVRRMPVDDLTYNLPKTTFILTAEWFWVSIQLHLCARESLYFYLPNNEHYQLKNRNNNNNPKSAANNGADENSSAAVNKTDDSVVGPNSGSSPTSSPNKRHKDMIQKLNQKKLAGGTSKGSLFDASADMSGYLPAKVVQASAPPSPASHQEKSTGGEKRRSKGRVAATKIIKHIFSTEDIEGQMSNAAEERPISKRQQTCIELLQTERNYVEVLRTITNIFANPLAANIRTYDPTFQTIPSSPHPSSSSSSSSSYPSDQHSDQLLSRAEYALIFGKVIVIRDIHERIYKDLNNLIVHWSDDRCIGEVFSKHAADLERAYPGYVNNIDKIKETLADADRHRPKFHAFLKGSQSKPECQRQTLKELLIRPVQRLPSVQLLLNDILKRTGSNHEDNNKLKEAIESIVRVLNHINEGKRFTEDRLKIFQDFQDIENFPVIIKPWLELFQSLVSAHRNKISSLDSTLMRFVGTSLPSDVSRHKGQMINISLFTDVILLSKRRNTVVRSNNNDPPGTPLSNKRSTKRQLKHLDFRLLTGIRRIVILSDVAGLFILSLRFNEDVYLIFYEEQWSSTAPLVPIGNHAINNYNGTINLSHSTSTTSMPPSSPAATAASSPSNYQTFLSLLCSHVKNQTGRELSLERFTRDECKKKLDDRVVEQLEKCINDLNPDGFKFRTLGRSSSFLSRKRLSGFLSGSTTTLNRFSGSVMLNNNNNGGEGGRIDSPGGTLKRAVSQMAIGIGGTLTRMSRSTKCLQNTPANIPEESVLKESDENTTVASPVPKTKGAFGFQKSSSGRPMLSLNTFKSPRLPSKGKK